MVRHLPVSPLLGTVGHPEHDQQRRVACGWGRKCKRDNCLGNRSYVAFLAVVARLCGLCWGGGLCGWEFRVTVCAVHAMVTVWVVRMASSTRHPPPGGLHHIIR